MLRDEVPDLSRPGTPDPESLPPAGIVVVVGLGIDGVKDVVVIDEDPSRYAEAIDDNDVLYAIDSESDDNYNPGWRKGLRIGSARTGEVLYYIREHVSERASGMGGCGSMGEGVTVDAEGNIYAGEVGPIQGLTKFVPRLIR